MAVLDDVKTELGSTTATDEQLELWIQDANALINMRAEMLGRTVNESMRDQVVRAIVVAHARRPSAETQIQTRIDDGSVSRTFASSAGRITIPDDDELWEWLGLANASTAGEWSGSIDYAAPVSLGYCYRWPLEYGWPG